MTARHIITLLALLPALIAAAGHHDIIDLSGEWNFMIDRNDSRQSELAHGVADHETIILPGSMPQRLKGDDITLETPWTGSIYDSSFYYNPEWERFRREGALKIPFFLTPAKHYVGPAWYGRTVTIPSDWTDSRIVLTLERPHISTAVWIDGQPAGVDSSLSVPHTYDLTTLLSAGRTHTIAIKIDNRVRLKVGANSHSVTDHTQGNWNGITGRIELVRHDATWIESIDVFPQLATADAIVKMRIHSPRDTETAISLQAGSFNSPHSHNPAPVSRTVTLQKGINDIMLTLPMGDDYLTWDEFSPALYRLKADIDGGGGREVTFGMREVTTQGKDILVNGRPVMLRGTVECCDFPLTGYPPTDVDSWLRIFNRCHEYGLNHVRFHSYCPPEAAFEAADLTGMYIQAEGPSWPNHDTSLGDGKPIDNYLMTETRRMTQVYGNHPSFMMLAAGNEPTGNWVSWVSDFVDYWRNTDSRRIYTGASVGGSWQWQPRNQYHVKAGARGVTWSKHRPESMSDFSAWIDTVGEPFVTHEMGQWCVFPDFNETIKYTGVNKARNFELFRDLLTAHGMDGMGPRFHMASGHLQALCYKHEIERLMRTPGYAGFQLLGLNDYSGQGSALVGVLDVFWNPKDYITANEFRRFCSPTVVLARLPRFVYTSGDTLTARIEATHHGAVPLSQVMPAYRVTDSSGAIVTSGQLPRTSLEFGNAIALGDISIDLHRLPAPAQYNLEVTLEGTDVANDWDFWVYPRETATGTGDVMVARDFSPEVSQHLASGGKVLIMAGHNVTYGNEVKQKFQPVFWNTSWFKNRPPHTLGLLIDNEHDAFNKFPTDSHSDLQWWELVNGAPVMQFSDFPDNFQPIVQSIDTWFASRKIGVLFEAEVLGGRLIMTTLDLTSRPDERIVARQLYHSILSYMNSDNFHPRHKIDAQRIAELFTKSAPPLSTYTHDSPDELKPVKQTMPASR